MFGGGNVRAALGGALDLGQRAVVTAGEVGRLVAVVASGLTHLAVLQSLGAIAQAAVFRRFDRRARFGDALGFAQLPVEARRAVLQFVAFGALGCARFTVQQIAVALVVDDMGGAMLLWT